MVVLLLLSAVTASVAGARPGQDRAAPGEIIVKLRPEASGLETHEGSIDSEPAIPPSLEALHNRYGIRQIRPLLTDSGRWEGRHKAPQEREESAATRRDRQSPARHRRSRMADERPDIGRIYRIKVDARFGDRLGELLEAYRRQPEVEYAELSHVIAICAEPNDPRHTQQWGMQKISASEAWDTCRGSAEVVVAVIDTGVDYNHRDLQANIWVNEAELHGQAGVDDDGNGFIDDIRGYNFAYNNNDPMDDNGHGTSCAGTIAAVGNNGLDIAGVCWTARIMPLKILGADGEGSSADAAPAIYYAVANGADVISSSWGSGDESKVIQDALAYARRRGVIVAAAAGNEGSKKPFYPAAYPGVIGVAATETNDRRWYLSNYGDWVDIAAPGSDVLSLRAAGTSSGATQDAFTMRLSGTSTAAPYVTGACALLLAANPFLTCDEVEQALLSTGDPIAAGICSSNSRLNVAKAMRAAVPPEGSVRFDRPAYAKGDEIQILLADWNLRGAGSQPVMIETDTGDMEGLTLAEMASAKGVFRGSVTVDRDAVQLEDGRAQVEHGARITVRYQHREDASSQSPRWVEAYAYADYEPPEILDKAVEVRGPNTRIELTTSEPTLAEIRYGDAPAGPYPLTAGDAELSDRHSIRLARLTPGRQYYFVVALTDDAGNEAIVDDGGSGYSFTTAGDFAGFQVPDTYPTIQAAIDDAWNGDTIRVADGTYFGEGNTEIDFRGRAITVRSENGPQSCIIDCRRQGRAFHFHSGEGKEAILEGFTIINGGNEEYGGGIRCVASSPTIRNCILRGNSAEEYGGGLCNSYGSSPTIVNCTISGNRAGRLCGGIWSGAGSEVRLENCILWANTNDRGVDVETAQVMTEAGDARIDYCCVQGWSGTLGGIGNFEADPLFVDPNGGNFHLRSRGWRWDEGRSRWTYDAVTSPCIDAGNPGRPLGDEPLAVPDDPGNLLAQNTRIDMGAHGGTAEASMAPHGWALLADLDNDGCVSWPDLASMAADWQAAGANRSGDLSRDGAVGSQDFALLGRQWRLSVGPAVVRIVVPEDGSTVPAQMGTPIEVEVATGIANVGIIRVEFFAGSRFIGMDEDGSDGWHLKWQDYTAGPVILVARAVGQNGVQVAWAAVRIAIE